MGLLLETHQLQDRGLPLKRLLGVASCLAVVGCRAPVPTPPLPPPPDPTVALVADIDLAMERGAAYLIAAQQQDGRWRSDIYGAMQSGRAQSPLVLSALLFSPAATPGIAQAYASGVDFLASPPKGALQYPVYALALGAMVLSVPANRRHLAVRDELITQLRGRQLTEALGWTADDASYGGWGYWPQVPTRSPPAPARITHELLSSNLSSTLFALAALVMAGVPPDDPAFAAARTFVERCQNHADGDGGFIFTPANDIQNKAGPDGAGGFRSYGTMTADGVRALFLLGAPSGGPRLQAASGWLSSRWDPAVPPGEFPVGWQWKRDAAYYYWAWSSAHALYGLGADNGWPGRLAGELLKRQEADGAWRNRFTSMREDDPLVATPLALAGLGLARMALTGQRRTSVPMR